jgi:RNA polymerase sigma-70 factor, ECF subfamily
MGKREVEERFQTLMDAHKGILFKVCNGYCRNRDDREDLAQEIVVQLWRSFGRFDERYRFSTWMYRIALNVAISAYRRERTRARYIIAADERVLQVAGEPQMGSENIEQLYALIESLEPLDRALVLLVLDGHGYRDIGEVLGLSESNVGTKLERLKKRMRRQALSESRE